MVTSLTNVAGVAARLLLAATTLSFNGPRLFGPVVWTHPAATEHVFARSDRGGRGRFHAELTVGRGKKQVTVQLEFGGEKERAEDESL